VAGIDRLVVKESFRISALHLHLPTAQLQLSDTENSGCRWIGKISVTVMLRQPFMLLSRKRYKYHGSYLFTGNSVNGYSGLKRMDINVTVLKIKKLRNDGNWKFLLLRMDNCMLCEISCFPEKFINWFCNLCE
jgi:hypothetical protein